jgi:2-amino-1-hydroxyethylphosphonate dioxygenase (glycine-forming)
VNLDVKVNGLFDVLERSQHAAYFGEEVSQLEHALQAAQSAVDAKAEDDLVIAALLHDIGHLIASEQAHHAEGVGVVDHDEQGATHLASLGFSPRVVELVRGHVAAKRYLTATNPDYRQRLSDASTKTLALQGGPMSVEEVEAFRRDPLLREKLQLRSWDEQAKRTDWRVAPLEAYREMVLRHLRTQRG